MKFNHGSTRNVFIFKHFVIKVPTIQEYRLFLNGLLANLQEKQWSGHHPDLAKVIFCTKSGLFLIMEKANVISTAVDTASFQAMIERHYQNDDLRAFMISDAKPSNWGYIGVHLVKIDYGN